MPSFSIDKFRSLMRRPGRAHLFHCTVIPPTALAEYFPQDTGYLCKAVTTPGETIEPVEVQYQTRILKIPGRRTFTPATLTFLHNERYTPRVGFQRWNQVLNAPEINGRGVIDRIATGPAITNEPTILGPVNPITGASNFYGTVIIEQFSMVHPLATFIDIIGNRINIPLGELERILKQFASDLVPPIKLARYTLHDAFPSTVNGLAFSYDSDAEIQTYDVEFQYQYMTFEPWNANLGKTL